MEIYIAKSGQKTGPFSEEQIQSMLKSGMIGLADSAWHEGMSSWIPLHQVLKVCPPIPQASQSQIPETSPQQSRANPVRSGPIIRDVAIIWALTFIGGFIVSIAGGASSLDQSQYVLAIAASNLLLGTVGFTISGVLAPLGRWRHLGIVAFWVWITGLLNVLLNVVTIPQWIGGSIFVAMMMGLGGALSYLFKRDSQPL